MNAEPEREMVTWLRTVDNEAVRFRDLVGIGAPLSQPTSSSVTSFPPTLTALPLNSFTNC